MKIFLNNRKIPLIPLYYENSFITDFKNKAELFVLQTMFPFGQSQQTSN